jgi:replicative DNA helicase
MTSIGDFLDKIPPQDLEAERCVLGSVLLVNEVIDEIDEHVSSKCFYADANRRIFATIKEMLKDSRGSSVDAVTLRAELVKRGELDICGGVPYLMQLLETVPHASHAGHYAKIVREKWLSRELIEVCTESLKEAYHGQDDAADLISTHERRLLNLAAYETSEVVGMEEAVEETMLKMFEAQDGSGKVDGVPIRFESLQPIIESMGETHMVVLAARPGQGKTALALELAEPALHNGEGVLLLSLEMPRIQITRRMLARMSSIPAKAIKSGNIEDYDIRDLENATTIAKTLPLRIYDGRIDQLKMRQIIRKECRQYHTKLVIIDYLQLIEGLPGVRYGTKDQMIGDITREIKLLANELRVPILLLAQLNREIEKRPDKRPKLSDLRDSGSIEQDADVVMFLHRPETDDPTDQPGLAVLSIPKNRHGPTGTADLMFDGTTGIFSHVPYTPKRF